MKKEYRIFVFMRGNDKVVFQPISKPYPTLERAELQMGDVVRSYSPVNADTKAEFFIIHQYTKISEITQKT